MGTPQPIDDLDRASLDGLEGVFDSETARDQESLENSESKLEQSEVQGDDIDFKPEHKPEPELERKEEDSEDSVDSKVAEQDDTKSASTIGTALAKNGTEEEQLANSLVDGEDKVSRSDLINLLEGFVGILRKDGELAVGAGMVKTQQPEELKFTDVDIEDKTAELEDMRRLVIEAQETIIKLLTDRVEDRAKIAGLETEMKLLPDLQEQADRAMAVAFKTEEFRTELHKMKYELEKNRIASVRRDMYKGPRGLLTRVQRWLIKAKGRSQLQFNDQIRQEKAKTALIEPK